MFLNKQKETEELTLQQQIISDQTKELEHRLEESKSGENNALMYQSFTSNRSNSTLSEKNTQNCQHIAPTRMPNQVLTTLHQPVSWSLLFRMDILRS